MKTRTGQLEMGD
jgi:hypothetical protein